MIPTSLTELQLAGVGTDVNVAQGYPRQRLTPSQQAIANGARERRARDQGTSSSAKAAPGVSTAIACAREGLPNRLSRGAAGTVVSAVPATVVWRRRLSSLASMTRPRRTRRIHAARPRPRRLA